jgi:tRNA(Arg) A34 adenosine deaminase TadA
METHRAARGARHGVRASQIELVIRFLAVAARRLVRPNDEGAFIMAPLPTSAEILLPDWIASMAAPSTPASDEACMQLAIHLARENVARRTGGPFGAVIRSSAGEVVATGVNLVEPSGNPLLHAEVAALSLVGAERSAGATLFSTCEPCIMCLGAAHWAQVGRIVSAALREDAEGVGFAEGDGCAELKAEMTARGVAIETGFLRADAAEILRVYRDGGGPIYGPKPAK